MRVCACVPASVLVISPGVCVCVLIEAISWRVCMRVVCVLTEECRAGSAPPMDDDVMADGFLFCEPVEWTGSQLPGGQLPPNSPVSVHLWPRSDLHLVWFYAGQTWGQQCLRECFLQANSFCCTACLSLPPTRCLPVRWGTPLIVLVVMFGCTSWGERSCVALAGLTRASE